MESVQLLLEDLDRASEPRIAMSNVINWSATAQRLKILAEAEAVKRPHRDRYPNEIELDNIPLLVLDCEPHDQAGSREIGVWRFSRNALDQFFSEYIEIVAELGKALPGRHPDSEPINFLLHNLSLFLWSATNGHGSSPKFLNLIKKPIAGGQWIQVRQIMSVIKATELFIRQLSVTGPVPPLTQGVPPWLCVDPIAPPGFQDYPKWATEPNGRHRIIATREEHAKLFDAPWMLVNAMQVGAQASQVVGMLTTKEQLKENVIEPQSIAHNMGTTGEGIAPMSIRPRGYMANMARHHAIVESIGRQDPHIKNNSKRWRMDSALKNICIDLDHDEMDVPSNWSAGRTPSLGEVKLAGWCEALELGSKKLVADQLSYSLRMVFRTSGTPRASAKS